MGFGIWLGWTRDPLGLAKGPPAHTQTLPANARNVGLGSLIPKTGRSPSPSPSPSESHPLYLLLNLRFLPGNMLGITAEVQLGIRCG